MSDQIELETMYTLESNEIPSEAVIAAVADETDRSPMEMDRLAETVDPDAIDALFRGDDTDAVSVTVDYCGCQVTVTPREIRVTR